MRFAFVLDGRTYHVTFEEHADGPRLLVDGEVFQPTVATGADGTKVTVAGETFAFRVEQGRVLYGPRPLDVDIRRARPQLVRRGGKGRRADGAIKPPMPGKVLEVHVKEGDAVSEGAILLVLEAMKMQNDLKSPMAGVVRKVHVKGGQNVEATTVLLEIDQLEA